MSRDNESWVADLSQSGVEQESALVELRDALLRNLRKALPSQGRADDSFLEDAVQDSLVRILDRLRQFGGRSRFITWATTIAIRVSMTELRRRRWRDVSLDDVIHDSEFQPQWEEDVAVNPAEQAEQRAILGRTHEIIQEELTEKQRTALLAEMKGVPLEEIARLLGSNRNAVYKLTHDARKKLKHGLEATGYVAQDIRTAFAY